VHKPNDTVHLVVTHHWYDEIASGRKTVEYRELNERWVAIILRNANLKRVTFHRGYTSTTLERRVSKVDVGPCPYNGWDGQYIRIHLEE
jgi:hypothetical protein